MSKASSLYLFLYNWAKRILITEAGLSVTIKKSHQNTSKVKGLSLYIDFSPNMIKIGSYSAGDSGDLSTEHQYEPTFTTANVNFGTDVITITAHEFDDNDFVSFTSSDTLPAGLVINTYYNIISKTTNTFQISATRGGAAIDITDEGVGTHTAHIEGTRTLVNDWDFVVELWEENGTGETLKLLIDSIDRQEIKDLWSTNKYAFRSSTQILNIPRLPQNKWKKEAMVELTIGAAEATLETSGIIEKTAITGTIPAQGGSGDHTVTPTP